MSDEINALRAALADAEESAVRSLKIRDRVVAENEILRRELGTLRDRQCTQLQVEALEQAKVSAERHFRARLSQQEQQIRGLRLEVAELKLKARKLREKNRLLRQPKAPVVATIRGKNATA
jgi:regulator of replication initiation timing